MGRHGIRPQRCIFGNTVIATQETPVATRKRTGCRPGAMTNSLRRRKSWSHAQWSTAKCVVTCPLGYTNLERRLGNLRTQIKNELHCSYQSIYSTNYYQWAQTVSVICKNLTDHYWFMINAKKFSVIEGVTINYLIQFANMRYSKIKQVPNLMGETRIEIDSPQL